MPQATHGSRGELVLQSHGCPAPKSEEEENMRIQREQDVLRFINCTKYVGFRVSGVHTQYKPMVGLLTDLVHSALSLYYVILPSSTQYTHTTHTHTLQQKLVLQFKSQENTTYIIREQCRRELKVLLLFCCNFCSSSSSSSRFHESLVMTIVNQFVGFILLLMKINVANFVEFCR